MAMVYHGLGVPQPRCTINTQHDSQGVQYEQEIDKLAQTQQSHENTNHDTIYCLFSNVLNVFYLPPPPPQITSAPSRTNTLSSKAKMPELSEEHINAVKESWDEVCKAIRDNGTELFIRSVDKVLILFTQ